MKTFISSILGLAITLLLLAPGSAQAQDFVYTPVNPAFGGSYLNYQWLLSSANAQNKYKGGSGYSYNNDPLANFEEQLQRQVLSQLTRNVIQDRFGDVDLSQQNTFEFGEFSIDIVPGANGVDINIFNQSSGEQTTVTVPSI
ncbi:curli assembly protein CsgF [Fodinibius salsisoli]|uniref:Curli production assembly/transport component CsgF n=1 Tax=Fodinibius salsisoli TaxID=2820877 RepID=A0ABT3PMJ5_9BACT|nr:curli assembly protein CsgF [Fodinibius salsisoli]MCW9707167.1 curli assembly protein CsgF [Fodinibius salsisoli]